MALNNRLARFGHLSYDGLDRLFGARVDPWHFDSSAYEQARFAKMLALVQSVPHARILEAGCAEGHFTQRLLTISDDVTAIDLSAVAIERAKLRAPGASFLNVKLEDMPAGPERFDVIVCGEMLYYLDDVAAIVPKLRQLGRYLVTSTLYPSAWQIHAGLAQCTLRKQVFHASPRELRAASIRLWEL